MTFFHTDNLSHDSQLNAAENNETIGVGGEANNIAGSFSIYLKRQQLDGMLLD